MRIPVPHRDDLIAMALATLAMGLVLGLAIGPGLGPVGRALPVIASPLAQLPAGPTTTGDDGDPANVLPTLSSPAGTVTPQATPGGSDAIVPTATTVISATPLTVSDPPPPPGPSPVPPAPTPPAGGPVGPGKPEPGSGRDPEPDYSSPLSGTVVALSASGRGYAIADPSGNLLAIHSLTTPPVGAFVATSILPLANGTFAESGGWQKRRDRTVTPIRGTVSWVDPEAGVVVLSVRGASIAIDAGGLLDPDPGASRLGPVPAAGSTVEAVLSLLPADPALPLPDPAPISRLSADSIEVSDQPGSAIELNGRIRAFDEKAGTITIIADSEDLTGESVVLPVPRDLDPSLVRIGRIYNLTARRSGQGPFRVTGLSPDFNRPVADDRSLAWGEHR